MKRRVFTFAGGFFATFLLFAAAGAAETRPRLVSLAPSLTEMAFAVGAGDLLVGVTDHCRYPPEAQAVAKVGGYQTPNFEAILALRPDVVLTLAEHSPSHPTLNALGISYVVFDHRGLAGVLDSFTALGKICGVEARAAALRREMEQAFAPPPPRADGLVPSMLVVFGRDYGAGAIANAYIIGKDGLYEKLIDAVGCRNAYRGDGVYPVLSGEGVAALDPDIVVETVYAEMGTPMPDADLLRDWRHLANLRAVRDGRLYFVRTDYVFIPGIRMTLLKRDLAALVEQAFPAGADSP